MSKENRKRIPDAKGPFNSYINSSTAHLETGTTPNRRGEVLGLTTAELDNWIGFRDDWNPLYGQYVDLNQRTSAITLDVNNMMKDFKTFAQPLLNKISVSILLNSSDRMALNLPERDTTPTRRGKIETSPLVGIKALGGGQMKFRVRVDEDASRASMHPLADLIEIRYMIQGQEPQPGPTPPDDGGGFPSPDKATNFTTSKKALFILELGTNHTGKFIVAFVRWANGSNPANSGPWSLPIIGLIM